MEGKPSPGWWRIREELEGETWFGPELHDWDSPKDAGNGGRTGGAKTAHCTSESDGKAVRGSGGSEPGWEIAVGERVVQDESRRG